MSADGQLFQRSLRLQYLESGYGHQRFVGQLSAINCLLGKYTVGTPHLVMQHYELDPIRPRLTRPLAPVAVTRHRTPRHRF